MMDDKGVMYDLMNKYSLMTEEERVRESISRIVKTLHILTDTIEDLHNRVSELEKEKK